MNIQSDLAYFIGALMDKCYSCLRYYKNRKINKKLGGGKRIVQWPFLIEGSGNIIASESVNIGASSTIFTTNAQLIIKSHFVSGPGLTIITGDHLPIIGRFLDTVTSKDKKKFDINHESDQDVIIEEDVWCGANVTILKGVTIGRGSIIAAGSVVVKSLPPYCIAGGIPAKPIKTRLSIDQIIEHEKVLYDEIDRYSRKEIESFIL